MDNKQQLPIFTQLVLFFLVLTIAMAWLVSLFAVSSSAQNKIVSWFLNDPKLSGLHIVLILKSITNLKFIEINWYLIELNIFKINSSQQSEANLEISKNKYTLLINLGLLHNQ